MAEEQSTQAAATTTNKMKVLVAVDESEGSHYAMTWALDHLLSPPGAAEENKPLGELVVLFVMQPFQQFVYPAGPAVYATSAVADSVKKAQHQNAEALLARAAQMCIDRKVHPQTLLMEGDPKEMICQAVEQHHVDLVVVGNRGLGAIKRAFLGSVSDYCAHHAKCPILIVKPPKSH